MLALKGKQTIAVHNDLSQKCPNPTLTSKPFFVPNVLQLAIAMKLGREDTIQRLS